MSDLIAWLEVNLRGLRRSIQLFEGVELIVGRKPDEPASSNGSIFLSEFQGMPICSIQDPSVPRGHLTVRWEPPDLHVKVRDAVDRTMIGGEMVPGGTTRYVRAGTIIQLTEGVYVQLHVEQDFSKLEFLPPLQPPADSPSEFVELLPEIYHQQDFLRRFLLVPETLWIPLEWRIDNLDGYFDPRTCPTTMLDWLASWVGVEVDPTLPEISRRRVVGEALQLYRDRGTLKGLRDMIRICVGIDEARQVEITTVAPFSIKVVVTRSNHERRTAEELTQRIERILHVHKPAHVAYVLEVR